MIVDSSALIAILKRESEAPAIIDALVSADQKLIAAPTYLETCMVAIGTRNSDTRIDVEQLLTRFAIRRVEFPVEAAEVAVQAFIQYGKGRKHKAQLNFGDCISYAMSKVEAMPLLFKGDDFRHTDVECAI